MRRSGQVQPRLIYKLRRASQAAEVEKGARLRPVGLRVAHFALLINVAESPGLSGAALSRLLGVTPQNVASLVPRLEKEGLIERRQNQRHDHVQELYLTTSGRRAVRRADQIVRDLDVDVATVLGAQDTAHLHRILDRLLAHLSGEPAPEGDEPSAV